MNAQHQQQAATGEFSLLGHCVSVCKARPARLVFPDGEDLRAVSAALRLQSEGLAQVTLMGRPQVIRGLLRKAVAENAHAPGAATCGLAGGAGAQVSAQANVGADVGAGALADARAELAVLDPASPDFLERNTADYLARLRESGKTASEDDARAFMRTPLAAGAMLVRRGEAEAGIGGNLSSTADMLRAGLRVIGTRPGSKTISGFFFMLAPQNGFDSRKILIFADSGVIPEPTEAQLVDITIDSAGQFRRMTGQEPKVALLSFSSHGSAKHPRAEFMRNVTALVRQRAPELIVDGELQFDAAMVPEVARQKVPQSPVAGEANVLIFPSLEAGNIGYKIAQRLGGYTAIGPLLQGLAGGWHDLSRGCSADD
ncbi:hypothetical protein LJC48_06710, partial [Desulfovibrio sp. OttesenSCG-928-C06]|nr:hypothetical protein [Desulfovibrio sp. OttesenSCG-928-C06]